MKSGKLGACLAALAGASLITGIGAAAASDQPIVKPAVYRTDETSDQGAAK